MILKAVAFDLDGTFYPYSRLILRSCFLAFWHPRFFFNFGRVRSEIRQIRPISDFHGLQTRLLADRMGLPYRRSQQLIEYYIYRKLEEGFKGVRPFPFLTRALWDLKNSGLKLAVLSDFPVQQKLRFLGLEGFWECTFCSEDTDYLKPNPEPFLRLADLLKLSPQEILYIGDKYDYDILGAHGVGMRTGHLARIPETRGVADFTFYGYRNFAGRVMELGVP